MQFPLLVDFPAYIHALISRIMRMHFCSILYNTPIYYYYNYHHSICIPLCDAIFMDTVSSVDIIINVLSSRQGLFKVTCIASGGTVVSSSLTGPGVVDLELQPVESIGRTGQNTYTVTSGILSGRSNGDTYQCTAAAAVSSPDPSDRTMLKGKLYVCIMHL